MDRENCRVMKSVLKSWFEDPKLLNLISPKSKYPFHFNDWKKAYIKSNAKTLVIKTEDWIIGQLSFNFKNCNVIHMFDLIIAPEYHRLGLAKRLISKIENIAFNLKKRCITLNILKNNQKAIFLYEKLGYKLIQKKRSWLIYSKKIKL